MKIRALIVCLAALFLLMMVGSVSAAGHEKKRPAKNGILLVAFGTSIPEAQVAFDKIDRQVKETFKDTPVRWAYTSHIIRKKLAKQGKSLDSVAMALSKMMDEGFTQVAVQSLHTIPGEEYQDLVHTTHAFQTMPEGFDKILVGPPLLFSQKDIEKTAEAIIANIPAERKKDEALILMGHGSPHPANSFYAALMFHLQRQDGNIYIGTVQGAPTIDNLVPMLKEKGVKKAFLMPFMSVAGEHARKDMAGEQPDSWKSILSRAGIKTQVVLKGTAEYDNMVDIWMSHLKEIMVHFKD